MRTWGLVAAAIATAWATAAAAEPVRLGDEDLGAVAIDAADIRAAALARDWLRGGFWAHDPRLTLQLDPIWTLRPSQPSTPQAVRTFALGATED